MKEFSRTRRSNHGSFIVDRRGTILGFDQAMEHLTGWPAVDVVGRNKDLSHSPTPEEDATPSFLTRPLYEQHIPTENGARTIELILNCRDGRRLEAETRLKRLEGPGERMLVSVLQVVARSASVEGVRDAQTRDALTGLPDRDAFASRLEADFDSARLQARPLAMVMLDVDHLREVNDRLGPEAGDDVLRKLAGILRVCVEDELRIARLVDDDFAILLPDAGRGEARQVAAGLRSVVERHRFFTGLEAEACPRITVSLGAASFPADADTERELVERSRDALHEARTMGRNRVWCYLRRPRVPVQVPVFFDGVDPLLVGYTRDLSPSGIFVQTSSSIDVGMRCALAFPLPGHDGKVHVVGRVVRTVPVAAEDETTRIPGLGVEFERFGGLSDRRAIESFLHQHESKTLRPETGPLSF